MPSAAEIEKKLYDWAPKELAFEWDNVGLLVGNGAQEVKRVLVALDITQDVADEAVRLGAQLIVAHHPVMNCTWHPVQTLREEDAQGKLLRTLVRENISAICMHTNLDAAEGGVNDALAEKLKLNAISMLGEDKIGRIGTLSCELPLEDFLQDVVKSLGSRGTRYIDGGKKVKKVAVGGGACRDYIPTAIALGCDTFVTSDLKYNDFLDTQGLNLIDAGHFSTENVIVPKLISYLKAAFPQLEIIQTTAHSEEVIQYYT